MIKPAFDIKNSVKESNEFQFDFWYAFALIIYHSLLLNYQSFKDKQDTTYIQSQKQYFRGLLFDK